MTLGKIHLMAGRVKYLLQEGRLHGSHPKSLQEEGTRIKIFLDSRHKNQRVQAKIPYDLVKKREITKNLKSLNLAMKRFQYSLLGYLWVLFDSHYDFVP
jgi:hypothetical protein